MILGIWECACGALFDRLADALMHRDMLVNGRAGPCAWATFRCYQGGVSREQIAAARAFLRSG